MPFDISGNFTRSYNYQQDRDNGIKILAARVDGEFDNFATGMNLVFFRDGRVPMQADLRMNINRITGLADGAVGSPALKFNTDANTGPYLDGLNRYAVSVNAVQRGVFTTAGLDITGALTSTGNITMGGNLVATQAYVAGVYAPLASPGFTGVPTAPTAAAGTNTTQIATTAFVQGGYLPLGGGTLNGNLTAPVFLTSGAGGGVLFNPRDGTTALKPVIYSPTTGQMNLYNGSVDILTLNGTGVTVTGAVSASSLAATGNITGGGTVTLTSATLAGVNLVKTGAFAGTAQILNDGGAQFIAGAAGQSMHLRADTILLRNQNTSVDFASITSAAAAFTVPITVATEAAGTNNTRVATTAFVRTSRNPIGQQTASTATITPTFNDDFVEITAQAAALFFANPTGTAVNMWGVVARIKDNGTARAITYDTQYRGVGVALPTTTVAGKTLVLGMLFNNALTKWDVVTVGQE